MLPLCFSRTHFFSARIFQFYPLVKIIFYYLQRLSGKNIFSLIFYMPGGRRTFMGDISIHFNRQEFACRCGCGFAAVDKRLNEILEDIRCYFSSPVLINSACRCAAYNKKVGGAIKSQHTMGVAADISVVDISPDTVADYVERVHRACSIGRYNTFTHIDLRAVPTRWDRRTRVS